jgi:hypothetical protein
MKDPATLTLKEIIELSHLLIEELVDPQRSLREITADNMALNRELEIRARREGVDMRKPRKRG